MSLAHLTRIRQLMAADVARHGADIALLKIDLVGMRGNPAHEAALDRVRGWVPAVDFDRLAALPPQTFGHAYARFLRDRGLAPFVLTDAIDPAMRARNAFGIRYATTHDMLHTLLGFGTDPVGELGVLAFTVGQRTSGWQRLQAVFAWLVYPFTSGFQLRRLARAWAIGLRQGRAARFLLAERLEDRFEDDLTALRADLGLDPGPPPGEEVA